MIIGASSNLQPAFDQILDAYSEKENIKIIYGSSGQLYHQIINNSPIHIFFSADSIYPLKIKKHLNLTQAPFTYAYGALTWVQKKSNRMDDDMRNYTMVVGDTLLSPYGKSAYHYIKMKNYQFKQIIFALNIGQVNTYITQGVVDYAMTSNSFMFMPNTQHLSKQKIPLDLYPKIVQDYIMIKRTPEAEKFISYFNSEHIRNILIEFGYEIPSHLKTE